MRISSFILFLSFVTFFVMSSDVCNDMYVNPYDGVDEDNDCTKTPCKTLARVFENIKFTKCDANIYVMGTNQINEPLVIKKKEYEVNIYSYGLERPTLIFSEYSFLEMDSVYSLLEGFNVRVDTIHYQEIVRLPSNGMIRDCIFEDIAFTETMIDVPHFDNCIIRNCSDAYGGGDDSRIFSHRINMISGSVMENNKVQILNLIDRYYDGVVLQNVKIKNTNDDSFDFNIMRVDNTTLRLEDRTSITGHNLYFGSTIILLESSLLSVHSSYIMDNNIFIQSGGFDHFVVECFNSEVYIDEDSYIKDNNLVYLGSDELKMGNVDCYGQHDLYECKITGPGKGNAECPMDTWVIILVIIVVLFTCAICYLCVIICCATSRRCCVYWRKKRLGTEIFQTMKKKKTRDSEDFMVINCDPEIQNEVISSTTTPVMYGGGGDSGSDDEHIIGHEEDEKGGLRVGEEEDKNSGERNPLLLGNRASSSGMMEESGKILDFETMGTQVIIEEDDEDGSDMFTPTIDLEKEEDEDVSYTYLDGLTSSMKKQNVK